MLIGTMDEPPSREQAEEFVGRWASGLAPRLDWLARELGARGGPELASRTEQLRPLLEFVVGHIGDERHVEPVPEWVREVHRRNGWTSYGAALVEGLMAFVDQIYQRHLGGVPWVLDDDPRSAYFRQPVPERRDIPPAWTQVIGAVSGVQRGRVGTERLRNVVENTLSRLDRLEQEEPGGRQPAVRVAVTPAGLSEWNYQVSIDEELVEGLTPEVYADLEDRLAAIPGVRSAMFEDREVCLLDAEADLDRGALQARVLAVVEDAAGQVT